MAAAPLIDAPFRRAEACLRWAFGVLGQGHYAPPPVPRLEHAGEGGAPEGRFPGLSALERQGEAALIVRALDRCTHVEPMGRDLLKARYLVPKDEALARAKAEALRRVAVGMAQRHRRDFPFLVDQVGRFCRDPPVQDDREWGRELRVSPRTIRRWRAETVTDLREIHLRAIEAVEADFQRLGHVAI